MSDYQPSIPPDTEDREVLMSWFYDELQRIADAMQGQQQFSRALFQVLNAQPDRYQEGDIVYADGTNWNPGSGAGVYYYDGTNWQKMGTNDFFVDVAKGNITGHSFVHKFGYNENVGTGLEPCTPGGIYRSPTSPVTIEAISNSTADDISGTGAQQITVEYLTTNFTATSATITMNGTSASTETIANVMRINRAYVNRSGSYANSSTPSQEGVITIREASGGQTWTTLPQADTNFGGGQSLLGVYTVPAGLTAYIMSATITVDSQKTVDCYFFARSNADDTSADGGYSGAMNLKNVYIGVSGTSVFEHKTYESYPEKTDIGFMVKAAASSEVSVEFELLLVAN